MMETHDIQSAETAVMRRDPAAWLEPCGRIKVKDRSKGDDGLMWIRDAKLGWLQRRMCEVIAWCLKHKRPVRLLIYKKRQTGASTGSVGALYWACNVFNMDALIVGGKAKQVANLWEIFKRYDTYDTQAWGHERRVLSTGATFGNGSRVVHESMQGKDAGRSGTWTFVLATEVARWAEEGVHNASDVLTGISNGVPFTPLSFVIWETTVLGGSGAFYEKWQGAAEFEEFQMGEEKNGFIRIFEPWFYGFDSWMPVTERERADILSGRGAVDAEEQAVENDLRLQYKLSPEQIRFWRWALDDCQGDPDQRDRDFPTTPEHGFRASVPGRFNLKHLKHMLVEAQVAAVHDTSKGQYIIMTQPSQREKDRVVAEVVGDKKDAQFVMYEKPMEGYRYVLAIDPMRGEEDEERKGRNKLDTHGVVVLRDGFYDGQTRTWVRPKVVACSMAECRWPITDLAEACFRLARYYGDCLIVPEANFDSGTILLLRQWGADVYEREKPATDKDAGEKTGKFGFMTRGGDGEAGRRWILEQLAQAIRKYNKDAEGIEILDQYLLDCLMHFVRKDGKEQALAGKFDDLVLALAIAYNFKGAGTRYRGPVSQLAVPRDILKMEAEERRGTSRTHRR